MKDELRLERTYSATPEEVFDAWTNPTVLERWWAPGPDWETPLIEVDLRVGGRYRLATRNPENGRVHTIAGEYTEIDRPNRLVYSWGWENEPRSDHISNVTVEFEPTEAGTTVVVIHRDLENDESYGIHAFGWTEVMKSLERRVFGAAERA